MKVEWAEGWDAARLQRYLERNEGRNEGRVVGFKLRSNFTPPLKLGKRVNRRLRHRWCDPCTPSAVHLSVEPKFFGVLPNRYQSHNYVGIMTALGREGDKWYGRNYTLVARVPFHPRRTRKSILKALGIKE